MAGFGANSVIVSGLDRESGVSWQMWPSDGFIVLFVFVTMLLC